MSVKRKGSDDARMPSMPSAPTKESSTSSKSSSQDAGKLQGSLPELVRSMQNPGYSDGGVRQKNEDKFNQLSRGDSGSTSSRSPAQNEQAKSKNSPMQALFLSVGRGAQEAQTKAAMKELQEIELQAHLEEEQLAEDSEENKAARSNLQPTSSKGARTDLSVVQAQLGTLSRANIDEIEKPGKKQSVRLDEDDHAEVEAEDTFGYATLGSRVLKTPGGKEITFAQKNRFVIRQDNGECDEIELRGEEVVIVNDWGDKEVKSIPLSLILNDGTKITIGPNMDVGVTNRQLFAQVRNGQVDRNNRSTLAGGLKDELMELGLSEAEASQKLEEAGNRLAQLLPEDVNIDDLAQFNAADLDYLFRDGEYLVRDSDGIWTNDASAATPFAQAAMQEARLEQTVWRMGAFSREAEDILVHFVQNMMPHVDFSDWDTPST